MSIDNIWVNVVYCRYLRRGKDIADSQLDVVNTEVARLQQRCESLEKQLDLANKDLSEERQKSEVLFIKFLNFRKLCCNLPDSNKQAKL